MLVLTLFQLQSALRRNGPKLVRRAALTYRRARWQVQRRQAKRDKALVAANPGSCRRSMLYWAALRGTWAPCW